MAAPQQEPAATEPSRRRRWHGAVQQAGSTPFLHPQKGLYPETAFDRRPEDARPVPRLLRIGGALQSAFGLDEGLLTPPLAMTAVPLALHSSRGRVCVLGSSPEVLPPPQLTLRPSRWERSRLSGRLSAGNSSAVRKRQELDAEEGLGHLSPFVLILRGHTSASSRKDLARWLKSPWWHRGMQRVATTRTLPATATPKSRAGSRSRASPCLRRSTTPHPTLPPATNIRCNPLPCLGPAPHNPPDLSGETGADTGGCCLRPHPRGSPRRHRSPRAGLGAPGHGHSHRATALWLRRCPGPPPRVAPRTPSPGCDTGASRPRWALPAPPGPGWDTTPLCHRPSVCPSHSPLRQHL